MSNFDMSNFIRYVLDTEDDHKSPLTDNWQQALRYMVEQLYMLLLDTGDSGSATSDPPDDTTGVLTDSGAAYDTDEHNGRTLLITSGSAKGKMFTIDDTTATTLVCTGDNLYNAGVRSGDTYKILYDLKVNTDGHDHDGINSAQAVMPLGRTLVACYADMLQGSTSDWVTDARWIIYVPTNASTLNMYCELRHSTGSGGAEIRLKLTDSGETEFTSSAAQSGSSSYSQKTITLDVSAAAAGIGVLEVQLQYTTTGDAQAQAVAIYWNT